MFYRQAWLEIDLDKLDHNIALLANMHPKKQLIAIIKANGYGLGDYYVAQSALANGATYLAVSSLDEALGLRFRGITAPILNLGYTLPEHLLTARKHAVTVSVDSFEHAQAILDSKITGLCLHIKVDTGMNRLGFKDAKEIAQAVAFLKEVNHVEGIYTHYVDSGCKDNPLTETQYQKFNKMLNEIEYSFPLVHADNSDAILSREDSCTNAMRAGIAMLGYSSYQTALQPVASLYAKLSMSKKIHAGETVSYSATYTAQKEEWISTLPIGYADGFLRRNQGRKVYLDGEYAEVVGRICMDQCMLRTEKPYSSGSIVELFGAHVPLEQMAQELDTIPYEILTGMSERLARIYRRETEIVAIENHRLDALNKR